MMDFGQAQRLFAGINQQQQLEAILEQIRQLKVRVDDLEKKLATELERRVNEKKGGK